MNVEDAVRKIGRSQMAWNLVCCVKPGIFSWKESPGTYRGMKGFGWQQHTGWPGGNGQGGLREATPDE